MKKSKLPLTILNAKKLTNSERTSTEKTLIAVKKLQSTKIKPYGFYRSISKMLTSFDE